MRQNPELVNATRRFSHAIAEGDGISVIAAVEDADAARAAEAQRAEALVVNGDPSLLREATRLPILWRADAAIDRAAGIADAVIVTLPEDDDEDHEPAQRRHEDALAAGLDCAVEVRSEEELERALELLDPEIFLSHRRRTTSRSGSRPCSSCSPRCPRESSRSPTSP